MSQTEPGQAATIEAMLAQAGFSPTPQQMEEILEAYPHVMGMLARLQHDYGFGEEPAHVFTPLKFVPAEEA